ncbi:DUF4832 domain-containing protein [Rubripirellula reticaptiva]|uniref:DUF4832 domain-containing protein n=1 Tax=Rubripirellula reticaptiva TaxID=2528013 RepID=A0A5C6F6Y3_9BACT|nr:DUF4832 domain-containing protein [Rubripirellula reticaptiva]TWU55589.1 hypothetical protein Poly59_18890 [Rubripirellula reticaptiva]
MPLPRLLPLIIALSTLASSSIGQDPRPVPLKSRITQVQPMTGIVLWSDNSNAAKSPEAIALEYRYCGYNEVVSADGQYDFTKVDEILDQIASRNHQAVLRFYFCYVGKETTVPDVIRKRPDYDETVGTSERKKTHFCDWSNKALQDFMLDFYTRFAKRYDNDRRIAFLQTGFGLWAEFHIYDGPNEMGKTFPTKQYQAKFLRHMDSQFNNLPWSISIDAADSDYTPLEDNADLLSLRFGVFDDSFLCKPHPKENAVNWKTLDSNRWKRQPSGGEFSYYNNKDQKNALRPDGPNGVSFEEAAKQFHISYMIGNDQPRFQPAERIKSASMATGYRFRVSAAQIKGDDLTLHVTNDGVAPIYRDAFFAAGEKRSTTSLRGLLPGETIECSVAGASDRDLQQISIQSDAILPTQTIQFDSDLR